MNEIVDKTRNILLFTERFAALNHVGAKTTQSFMDTHTLKNDDIVRAVAINNPDRSYKVKVTSVNKESHSVSIERIE